MSASDSREVRTRQLEKAQTAVTARQAVLTEKGVTEAAAAAKDPVLKNLKAGLRKARNRIVALDAAIEHVQKTAEAKKAPQPKGKGDKKAKAGKKAAAPAQGNKKAKKK